MFQRFNFLPDDDIITRTRWYIYFRWFYIFTITAPVGLSILISEGWGDPVKFVISVTVLISLTNVLFYTASVVLKRPRHFQILAILLLLTDITTIGYLILSRGGIESRSVILFVIPIIMSAVLLGRKGIVAATGLILISYNAIILADYLGVHRSGSIANPALHTDPSYVSYIMIFFSATLISASIATGFLVKLLRQKERQALRTVEDLKKAQAVGKFGSWEMSLPGKSVSWTEEIYRILGVGHEHANLTYDRYVGFIHPKDRRRFMREMVKAMSSPYLFSIEYRLIASDATLRYVRSDIQSFGDRLGRVFRIIGTAHDVTDERLLDQTKNEFVSLASHQLRTPATVVKQYLGMLLDGYAGELTEKQRNWLQIASDTNDHQITIMNGLLGVAQLESGKVQLTLSQVDLVPLLRSLIDEYTPRAAMKQQVLTFSSRYKHMYCRADEHALRTVLDNILDNAFKYSMPGKAISLKLAKELNTAVISVVDQGIGIASKDMPKLFKKFSRIENQETFQEQGAGLGLYLAEKVMELHRGKILIESERGKGTTVKLVLPMRRRVKKTSVRRRRVSSATAR